MSQNLKSICIALMVAIILTGCQTLGGVTVGSPGYNSSPPKYKKHGPPPHAPAHGYRHKYHDGHELQYDSGIDAYVVVKVPDTYFSNDLYIRMSTDGTWIVSATLKGGWRVAGWSEVPSKLRYQHKGKYKKKGKSKKHKQKKYSDDD